MTDRSAAHRLLQPLPVAGRWAVLLAASVAAGLLLWARLPAALISGRWRPLSSCRRRAAR